MVNCYFVTIKFPGINEFILNKNFICIFYAYIIYVIVLFSIYKIFNLFGELKHLSNQKNINQMRFH